MSLWYWVALAVGLLVLVIVGLVGWAIIDGMKQDQRYLEQGTRVLGWIVQANPVLYTPGGMDNAALVLISFDAKADPPDPFMYQLADQIAQVKNGRPAVGAEAEIAITLADDTYRPFQRIRIPDELTGGREVYAMHVWVSRALLPGTTLQYVFVRCLVIRDDPKSRAMMVKYEPHDEAFRGENARMAGV